VFLAFAKMSLAGFGGVLVGARRGIVAPLDAGTVEQFNKAFALCHFPPQAEHRQFVCGVRFALWWHCPRSRSAGSLLGFAGVI